MRFLKSSPGQTLGVVGLGVTGVLAVSLSSFAQSAQPLSTFFITDLNQKAFASAEGTTEKRTEKPSGLNASRGLQSGALLEPINLGQVQQWSELALIQDAQGDRLGADAALAEAWQVLAILKQQTEEPDWIQVEAQLWNRQGQLYWRRLEPQAALNSWIAAEEDYRSVEDMVGTIGAQINQLHALQTLGQYRRAVKLADRLEEALNLNSGALDTHTDLLARQQLGQVLAQTGQLDRAQRVLEQAIPLLGSSEERSQLFLLLGNTTRSLARQSDRLWKLESARTYYQQAFQYYETAVHRAQDPLTQLEIQVNQMSLWVDQNTDQKTDQKTAIAEISNPFPPISSLSQLRMALGEQPASLPLFQVRLHFIYSLLRLERSFSNPDLAAYQGILQTLEAVPLLTETLEQAERLNVSSPLLQRMQSEIWGLLAEVYAYQGQSTETIAALKQALGKAETTQGKDLVALWQWQMGKTLEPSNRTEAAYYYRTAFDTVQSLRDNLIEMSIDTGFSLQSQLSSLYRDYIRFLLSSPNPSQGDLAQALEVMEALQLVELNNFFQEPCLSLQPLTLTEALAQSHTQAAALYSIALPDALAVIFLAPDGTLRHSLHPVSPQALTNAALLMRSSLNPAFSAEKHLSISRQLYHWLVEPFEAELAAQGTETLVFVLDGVLRNVPMATLYDGDRYLVERFEVTLTPGLKIVPPNPKSLQKSQILIAGLTEGRSGFQDLPGVLREVNTLSQVFAQKRLRFDSFLDERFTQERLHRDLAQGKTTILHLATHGQFSSDPNQTFILTGDDWLNPHTLQNRILAKEFTSLLNFEPGTLAPLDLLVLSACQTALGDEQASLGLAGLAARSGASSTIGTLWAIDDQVTADLMIDFYKGLIQGGETKAAALRRSQLQLLHSETHAHPYYWAPFILVGNWN